MRMRKFLLFLFVSLSFISLEAAIRVSTSAPNIVAQGQQFNIQYTINTQVVSSIGNFPKMSAFEILYGPAKSTSYSFQSINGKQSQSSATTYSYTLMAKKKGTFTLPGIILNVSGHSYKSNSFRIQVVSNGGTRGSSHTINSISPVKENVSGKISNKDLFIAVTANKSQVYEQEPVVLTYRVYTKLNLTQLAGKMPDLKGFLVKEIPLPQQKSFSVSSFHGENYYTTVWSQYVMFPQQTGKLVVPKIRFDGVVSMSNPNIDPIDAFFNGNTGDIRKEKSIMAPSLTINVKSLPAKPVDFSGGVGNFTIKTIVKNPKLKENETLDFQVIISGTGNMDLIKAPTVKFPLGFDTYDPKMTNNSKITANNLNGNVVIDYLAVPKNKGDYTIPSIGFTYFDTRTNSYKTIYTVPIKISVAKGEKNIYSDKQDEILARSDIKYIRTGDVTLHQKEDLFWNTARYWFFYILAIVLFGNAFYIFNHRKLINSNVALKRSHCANRLAVVRLKKAYQLMKKKEEKKFYEEMLSVLFGYVSDKFSISTADLSKEWVEKVLFDADVSQNILGEFMSLLDKCEFLRYSGSGNEDNQMEKIYENGLQIISQLDSVIKKQRKK